MGYEPDQLLLPFMQAVTMPNPGGLLELKSI